MSFKKPTVEQEKLLFRLLEARDRNELASDSFIVIDASTYGGSRVIVESGSTNVDLAGVTLTDFMPLAESGYLRFNMSGRLNGFGSDRSTWHGAVLEHAETIVDGDGRRPSCGSFRS